MTAKDRTPTQLEETLNFVKRLNLVFDLFSAYPDLTLEEKASLEAYLCYDDIRQLEGRAKNFLTDNFDKQIGVSQ